MLKNFFKAALTAMLNRWISGAQPAASTASASPIHLNTEGLKALFLRIASLTTLVLLNFLLFVAALVVTAVAIAHSIDLSGHFESTSVFWAGLIMGLTALVLGAVCGYALLKTKISAHDLVLAEPAVKPIGFASFRDRLVMPLLEGLYEGFRRPGTAEPYDRNVA